MSENRNIIMEVVQDREPATSESCVDLAHGIPFQAEVEQIADLELNTALGRDPREAINLHALDRNLVAGLAPGIQVSINLFGSIQLFEITRRSDNPGDPQVEFGARKVVRGLDT